MPSIMEGSNSGVASSSGASTKPRLLDLPAENLAHVISYVTRKSLFSLLLVSHQFHQLASAALYRNLSFSLAETNGPSRHRDSAFRLADALHTILTSSYDYSQHVKFFSLRMVESDADYKQKRIAAKFLPTEEAGMLLSSALLVMIRRAKGLEQFSWQVPIECSSHVYQALAKAHSLQTLHLHFDVQSVAKHSPSFYPPPPPPPGPMFGGQTAVWWDPMSNSSLPSGSIPSTATHSKSSKPGITRSKVQNRKLGAIKGLQDLTITGIDDLACLEEVASCIQASSGSLKTLTLSFAEALVSKSQKPNPNNIHNTIHMHDDDATTEPNSPDLHATPSAPTDLDLKRERQAQEAALARIFGLDKIPAASQKHDKKVEKLLKNAAKGRRSTKADAKALDNLAFQILSTIQISKLEPNIKAKVQDLVDAIMPFPISSNHPPASKKSKISKAPKKSKWNGPSPPMSFATLGPPVNWNSAVDQMNSSSSKPAQQYVSSPDFDDFMPAASSNNLNNHPLVSWNSNTSQHGLLANGPAKIVPPFGSAGFQPPPPKSSHLPILGPGSTYTYHPNASPSMVNSVSQSLPFYIPHQKLVCGEINTQSFNKQIFGGKMDSWVDNANDPGLKSHLIPNNFLECSPKVIEVLKKILLDYIILKANGQSLQSQSAFPNKKKETTPINITIHDSSSDSSSDSASDSDASTNPGHNKPGGNLEALDGVMSDFDMDHPDAAESDGGEDSDEANVAAPTSADLISSSDVEPTPAGEDKGKEKAKLAVTEPLKTEISSSNATVGDEKESSKVPTVEESIQEYVRTTHGLSIQYFALCYIPLKSSVIAKALDLTVLRLLVLFNVGRQGAFWTMIEKLIDQGTVFNFQSLYTDDVSPAFVSSLGKLSGLRSIHLLRRSSKEFSNTSSKPPATLTDIHRNGLSKHLETLQSLSITNLEDDSWDIDDKLIRAMASKAKKLRELAFSTDSNSFHTFLRCLPGFRSLVALHVVNVKVSPTPNFMIPHNEWKKLILDVLCYYPSMKLRYVGLALVNQGRVSQIGEKPKVSISSWYKKQDELQQQAPQSQAGTGAASSRSGIPIKSIKGKGKAPLTEQPGAHSSPAKSSNTNTGNTNANGVPGAEMNDSDEGERPNVYYSKTFRTSALADSYTIYSSLVLRGRL